MATSNKKEHKLLKKLLTSLMYQIIGAAICFSLIYGMYISENPRLNQYATAIGQALRNDPNFEASAMNAATYIKDKLIPDSGDTDL